MPAPDDPRFPLTAAQLIADWAETLFFGIYVASCAFAARTLLLTGTGDDERWLHLNEIRWLMMFVFVTFFVVITFDTVTGIYHNYAAFVVAAGKEGALQHFLNLADWVNVARSVMQCISTLLADFVLIYRCWIVYGNRWLIIVPSFIIYLATWATSIRFIQVEVAPATDKNAALSNSREANIWLITLFGLAAGQNILSTGLLIYRIWKVDRELDKVAREAGYADKHRPKYLRKLLVILAESGAFYTLTVILSMIVALIKSPGVYTIADISFVASGIVFNVILVRASKVRDNQFTITTHNYEETRELSTFRISAQLESTYDTRASTAVASSIPSELKKPINGFDATNTTAT